MRDGYLKSFKRYTATNARGSSERTTASALDRQADIALHFGQALAAERLSQRAAELREGAR